MLIKNAVYPLAEFCEAMKISADTLARWEKEGAPIMRLGEGCKAFIETDAFLQWMLHKPAKNTPITSKRPRGKIQ
jgi:predicted site-specific integrase-resolvase